MRQQSATACIATRQWETQEKMTPHRKFQAKAIHGLLFSLVLVLPIAIRGEGQQLVLPGPATAMWAAPQPDAPPGSTTTASEAGRAQPAAPLQGRGASGGLGAVGPPSVAELFSPRYLSRTVVLWVMWATMNFSYYGIFLWLPLQFVRTIVAANLRTMERYLPGLAAVADGADPHAAVAAVESASN